MSKFFGYAKCEGKFLSTGFTPNIVAAWRDAFRLGKQCKNDGWKSVVVGVNGYQIRIGR